MATKLQQHIKTFTTRELEMFNYLRQLFDAASKDLVQLDKNRESGSDIDPSRMKVAYTRQTQAGYCMQVLGINIYQATPQDEAGTIELY